MSPTPLLIPLADGAPNSLEGVWPDRVCKLITRPELHAFLAPTPARGRALVYAGGGYLQLMHDKEGVEIARWLNGLGLDAYVLLHRLPGQDDGSGGVWPFDIALQDGLLALTHLQALPALPLLHVGLSSGGHLAGVMACQGPSAGALIAYAPINANHRDYKAPAGKPDFPPPEKQAFYDAWPIGVSAEPQGLPRCPLFIAYALHDTIVPIDHALNLIKAAQQHGLDLEAHVFPAAPHGFALRQLEGAHAQWPLLAERWIAQHCPQSRHEALPTRLALLTTVLLLAGCANTPQAVPKPFVPDVLSAEDRQAAYAEVVSLIQTRYIDAKHQGVDWAATAERYRERVLRAPDDKQFWEQLNRLVGELKDAHSRVLSPLDIKATREQRGSHGLEVRQRDDRWLLVSVAGNSQAALLGLRQGQQLLQVDGLPVQQWWSEQAEQVRGSSTERSRQVLINGKLNGGDVGSERRLQLRRGDGSEFSVALRQDALQSLAVRAHLLQDGSGYLRFAGFASDLRTEIDHALRRLSTARGLVLDLRGNPGGDLKLTTELLGWFLPPGEAGKVVTRDNKRLTALLGLMDITPDLVIKAQAQLLKQPLAVLVDERSASAAELMAAALQAKGRARVFGATSCGCLLGVRKGEALRGGGRLVFSEIELQVDGQPRIEGVGVLPNEAVWADPGALLLGRDAVLDAARAWLDAQPAPAKAPPPKSSASPPA